MTEPRKDDEGTQFEGWSRGDVDRGFEPRPEIDSKIGYHCSDLDLIWRSYRNGKWLLLEQKRRMHSLSRAQKQIFPILHVACCSDPDYQGFYLVQFENTHPGDGRLWLNGMEITEAEFIEFLRTLEKPAKVEHLYIDNSQYV